tara:strand:- start:275 stop:493 length:219 start_codon:yes stop_codon:yes gene_type:complete
MNKHIELVKKWLDDKESVTREELEANANAAFAACVAAAYDTAYYYAYYAAYFAADYVSEAKYWIKRYEELTK